MCDVLFPGWGETWSIENLDTFQHGSTEYCRPLVTALSKDPYFVSNITIRGAPLDFRRAPNQNMDFVNNLKILIEQTYELANQTRVVLLGHSLGSKYSSFFLHQQETAWKKKYIRTFVALSAPLGGSMKALKIEASGDNLGFFLRKSLSFRSVQRSMPSLAFLLPDPRLWSPAEPIILTPTVNYSAHDYHRFFKDVDYELGYNMLIDTNNDVDYFKAPTGIDEIYCIHGSGLNTIDRMIYYPASIWRYAFPDQDPYLDFGKGDGTVNMRSLEVCKDWPGVKYIVYPGAEHVRIMGDARFIDFLGEIVGADIPKLSGSN